MADLEQAQWLAAGLPYMETAVRAVASQTRARLLLAKALLKRVQLCRRLDEELDRLVDQAVRNLVAADITYERVASVHDALLDPVRATGPVNLSEQLAEFQRSLPDDEAAGLVLLDCNEPVVVQGDADRLCFAFRSLLGYLLTIRLPETAVEVHMQQNEGTVGLSAVVSCRAKGTTPDDPFASSKWGASFDTLEDAERRAYSSAVHGMLAVRRIIEGHGGVLSLAADGKTREARVTRLPAWVAPDGPAEVGSAP